jgi:hypothetical protein
MKTFTTLLFAILVCILSAPAAQANSLCQGKEGMWISEPVKDPNFGNYYLGGMCDNNSCYHITISNDEEGQDMVGLTFTCDEIGDGTQKIQWVFVDVKTGEKHEFMANLQEVNEILRQTLNEQ